MPSLPAGRYRLFGDITLENGLSLTVTNEVSTLPAARQAGRAVGQRRFLDDRTPRPRDSRPAPSRRSTAATCSSGAARIANPSSGKPIDLGFTVRDATGAVASLQPYLGMAAHAVVMRDDASVFIHLHPMGTVSMVGQQVFALATAATRPPVVVFSRMRSRR